MAVVPVQCPQCVGIHVSNRASRPMAPSAISVTIRPVPGASFCWRITILGACQRSNSASWTSRSTAVACGISSACCGSVQQRS
jgi:hypothetical protein